MNDEAKKALWAKLGALYEFLQDLNLRVKPADRPDFEGTIRNAELEITRIQSLLDAALGGYVPFPSEEQLRELQRATGELQQAVEDGADMVDLIAAANQAVATWPITSADDA